ncbi:MAG: PAS domain S-box protein [Alphaproteobacteria bacterium]
MNAHTDRYEDPAASPDALFIAATRTHPDAVVILDRLGRIRYVSPASRRLTGYRPGEIVGTHVTRWVHQDDLHQLYKLMARRNEEGTSAPLIGRICHADGRWRWLEATPLTDGLETPEQFIFLMREITGRRRLEQQYRMAENIAGFGVWRVELDHPYPEFSSGMMNLFGYDAERPAARKKRFWPLSLVHRADTRHVLDTFRRVLKSPQLFSFACRIHTRNGVTKIVKTRGYVETDVAGSAVAVTGVTQDVTLISRVHKELKASEEKYRLLTDRASDIICQLLPDGTIEFVSPAVRRILGRDPGKLEGENFSTVLIEGYHDRFRKFLRNVAAGEEDPVCTVRAKCAGEGTAWLELSGRRLKEPVGTHSALVCTARDVTERKQFEFELVNARLQAEEANASKSRFLTNVSHDLRTPLNAILGFAELIREQIFGPVGDRRYAEYASLIYESGTLLRSFLSDLLDLSRIEAGKYELHPERFKLREVVPSCVRQILPLTAKKRIKIEDEVSETDLDLFADRQAVAHILINLLSNAAKFTPDEGRIEVKSHPEDGMAVLAVCDTGIGIKQEDIDRVTAPFERTFMEYGFAQEGTGLGLAIVKSLAELHGGALSIESEPGKGTCVFVRLPRRQMEEAA